MRVLVCGGRDYAVVNTIKEYNIDGVMIGLSPLKDKGYEEYNYIFKVLNKLEDTHGELTIISGMAKGADTAAADWAVVNEARLEKFPAEWKKYGKSAGYIRNVQMLDEGKPDLVLAFPGGKGTAMMVNLAKKAGITVQVID